MKKLSLALIIILILGFGGYYFINSNALMNKNCSGSNNKESTYEVNIDKNYKYGLIDLNIENKSNKEKMNYIVTDSNGSVILQGSIDKSSSEKQTKEFEVKKGKLKLKISPKEGEEYFYSLNVVCKNKKS